LNTVLGIDPGTHCGWALRTSTSPVSWTSGVWDLSPRRHEGGGMRFLRLRKYLQEVLDTAKPQAVFYEEVRNHKGVDAAHIYGGVIALIAEECESRGVPYQGVSVGTVKKLATGKGNAGKEQMIAAANLRWPETVFCDDNEVDARFIAETGAQVIA
jgi:Holliday junction resolvasome RuvABC endonuclease subunit